MGAGWDLAAAFNYYRGNLGDQTLKEFQQYTSPYNNFKFTEEYIVQRLQSNTLDTTARVCICTIQRMYSMLKDKELPEELEEDSIDQLGGLFKQPEPLDYNPAIPIETFDIIVTDECHRSIYNLWAQVLEYFKDHFVIVDAVGVCEQDKTDSRPLEQKPTVSFDKLLQAVAFGNTEAEVLTSLAGRLARMEHRLKPEDDKQIRALSGGLSVRELSHRIIAALDPDCHFERAKVALGRSPGDDKPIPEPALAAARHKVIQEAIKPFYDPELRKAIDEIKKKNDLVIDHVSADEILETGFALEALGLGKVHQLFGKELNAIVEELNQHLAA